MDTTQQETKRAVPKVVAVRFGYMAHLGEFTYDGPQPLYPGVKVILETDRGIELGEVASCICSTGSGICVDRRRVEQYVRQSGEDTFRTKVGKILRVATEQDLYEYQHIQADAEREKQYCSEAAKRLGLEMRVVSVEHLFGGERIVFYFTANGRVDFRELVKDLAREYQTRIEMRQIGSRDEARILADYEICGRQCCCKNFLKTFKPVNMKMAKLQKATLDPSKVSGRCGRLRCCLRFEHQTYEELSRELPRLGSRIETDAGTGVVRDRQVLTQLVQVQMENDGRLLTVPIERIVRKDLPKQATAPPPSDADGVQSQTAAQAAPSPPKDAGRPATPTPARSKTVSKKPAVQPQNAQASEGRQDGKQTAEKNRQRKRSASKRSRRRRGKKKKRGSSQGKSDTAGR